MAKFDLEFFKKFDAEELEEIIIAYEYHRDSYGEVFDAVRAEMEYENERDDDYDEDERFEDSGEDVETIEQNRADYFAETSSALDLGTAMGHDSIFYDVEEIIQRELNKLYRDIGYNEDHVYSEINRLFNASIDKLKQLQKEAGTKSMKTVKAFVPSDKFLEVIDDLDDGELEDLLLGLQDANTSLIAISDEIESASEAEEFTFGFSDQESAADDTKSYEREIESWFNGKAPIEYTDFKRLANINLENELISIIRRAKNISDFRSRIEKLSNMTFVPVIIYIRTLFDN